jgi:hypothetical protein
MNIDERWKAIFSAIGVIIVNAAALMGIDLGDGANIQDVLLGCAWLASLAWAIWKNHNFTAAAAEGQRVVDAIKAVESATGQTLSAELALELTDGADHDD